MSKQFTNPEQALIERLQRAPQPELSPEAVESLHARLMDALDNPLPTPSQRPPMARPIIVLVAVVAGALLITAILFALSTQDNPQPTPTVTLMPTTVVPVISSPVITSTPLPAPTTEAPAISSPSPTVTTLPTVVAAPTLNTIVVIEGPVQAINGNVVTIYNLPIQLSPDDPLLKTIVVGDMIRVEGSNQVVNNQVIVIALTVTGVINNVEVNSNPSTGETWRDDGSCANPPPDWAPANGWRRRCQGADKQQGNGNQHNNKGHDDDDQGENDDD